MTLTPIENHGAVHLVAEENREKRLPFSQAVRVGNLLFVSGQASVDRDGNIVSGTFAEEFARSFENMRIILEAAGSSLDRVVQVRSFVRDSTDGPEYNKLYRELFKEPFPARTTITGCLPATLRFEVECIATVGD